MWGKRKVTWGNAGKGNKAELTEVAFERETSNISRSQHVAFFSNTFTKKEKIMFVIFPQK